MTTTLSGSLGLSLGASYKDVGDRVTSKADLNTTYTDTLTNGTASGQCNRHYSARLTVPAASNVEIDLASLTDVNGAALTFVKVKHLIVKAITANANKVTVGGGASNPFTAPLGGTTPTFDVFPDDSIKLSNKLAGWTVDGTHKTVKFASAGAQCFVDVDIFGTDA